ncbi:hypothetical protein [Mesorhizobium captivum]|uniref:hypothetical protein n=1 Tax=Mesorhizobium captivum TaxID=3072319 RepID=UPI002A242254|nr:hypothetical protein [Mesorhizobium sp. VK23E]MDX8511526.1 hypothetical protein [Mesorhizobium sp. VK23E]
MTDTAFAPVFGNEPSGGAAKKDLTMGGLLPVPNNGRAFLPARNGGGEPPDHMAPIQIAMEMRKVLMQTSETTS